MKFSLAIIILAGIILSAGAVFAKEDGHKPITRELILTPQVGSFLRPVVM